MTVCPSCGRENADDSSFCSGCAAALVAVPAAREERKVVTVVFADLVGSTAAAELADPEDVRARLSTFHRQLRIELERFGGTVEKFIGDAVMAVFGAPVAHEDDPERAVRAALAIRDAIVEEGTFEVRIAVNTGEALVSLGARAAEGESMVAGDVVNTAARVQSAAPVNGILAGETTWRATRDVIEYQEAEPVAAKGKAEPVAVWEAVQPRSRYGVDVAQTGVAIVGRERELALLAGAFDRARQERSPQLVTLAGAPGIGKSRLVYELFAYVEQDPELIYWRQGRSLPYGEGVSYWALAEMIKAHTGILESDTADEAAEKLRSVLADSVPDEKDAGWIEGHFRPLVGLSGASGAAADRRDESFAAWTRFFEALGERNPVVLVFEDLHWADDGLLDFVDHLVDWANDTPLFIIGTTRTELFERRPGWAGGKPNALTISLSPLSDEETARLIGSLLARPLLDASVQTELLARAGGNPLYAEQFARMLAEGIELAVPETVQGIIAARLDRLPPEEKALLQDAAVVGKVFWAGAVGNRVDELHALERKEFIQRARRSSVAAETEYAFRHALVRDVAYGQIPRAARGARHVTVAEWLETLSSDRSEDRAEMLAHHYLQALDLARATNAPTEELAARALPALREAGDRALALSAFAAAEQLYTQALALAPADNAGRPHLLFSRVKARASVGDTHVEEIAEARDALLAAADRENAAVAEVMLAEFSWLSGKDGVFASLERGLELVREVAASAAKARVLGQLARFNMLARRHHDALRIGREAVEMAEQVGADDIRADALNTIGITRVNEGDAGGTTDLEESIAIGRAIRAPLVIVRGLNNLAAAAEQLGDVRRAMEFHGEAERTAEDFGFGRRLRWQRATAPKTLHWLGRWDEALRGIGEALGRQGEFPGPEAGCRGVRAVIALARDDVRVALAESEIGLAGARAAGDAQMIYPLLVLRAHILLETGVVGEARPLVEEAIAWWRQDPSEAFTAGVPAADAVARTFLTEQALAAIRTHPRTRWREAGEAYLAGDYVKAAEAYAVMGALPDEAYARLQAAKAGDLAQLERALSFWRSVGATRYVREGEALLAASA